VPLDVLKLRRLLEGRLVPVQVAHPAMQIWVAGADVAQVALEVLHVDGVKSDQRHVAGQQPPLAFYSEQNDVRAGDSQSNVDLGQRLAKVERPFLLL
jgi:hypothetical protein